MPGSSALSSACPPPGRDKARIARSLAVIALALLSPVAIHVSAAYSGTTANPASSLTSGTVDIASNTASSLVTLSNMAPGDAYTAPVTISNAGSIALRYAVTSTTTENPLAAQLVLTVRSGITTGNCTTANIGTGSGVYSGILGTTTGTAITGDVTQGSQAGDRVLSAGSSEVLCFSVAYPLSTTTAAATTTTATFAFPAEQTPHNP